MEERQRVFKGSLKSQFEKKKPKSYKYYKREKNVLLVMLLSICFWDFDIFVYCTRLYFDYYYLVGGRHDDPEGELPFDPPINYWPSSA